MPEYPLVNLATQRPHLGHCVYRFLDAESAVLYVGSTGNVWYRIGQHAAERPWWPEVDWVRTLVECVSEISCPGRPCRLAEHAEMISYETSLIQGLQPRHNTLHNGYCRSGRHLLAEYGKPDHNGSLKCGACLSEKLHKYYLANRTKALADATAYYQANRDKILARKRKRRTVPGPGQLVLPEEPSR